jgi:hypothetical protein
MIVHHLFFERLGSLIVDSIDKIDLVHTTTEIRMRGTGASTEAFVVKAFLVFKKRG